MSKAQGSVNTENRKKKREEGSPKDIRRQNGTELVYLSASSCMASAGISIDREKKEKTKKKKQKERGSTTPERNIRREDE